MDKIKIGIDLDNTITASKESQVFFALITNALKNKAEIHIITNRDTDLESRENTIKELSQMNIYYDTLTITDEKETYILAQGITIYYDDTDEYYQNLPSSVTVFKIREPGNFNFSNGKWIYGDKTGEKI